MRNLVEHPITREEIIECLRRCVQRASRENEHLIGNMDAVLLDEATRLLGGEAYDWYLEDRLVALVEGLAEQQAMPDDSYKAELARILLAMRGNAAAYEYAVESKAKLAMLVRK